MPYEVQSPGVDILVVQFGLNDCNHCETDAGMPRVIPLAFAANLKEIVMRDQKFGARRVFLNSNHPTTRDYDILRDTSIAFEQSNRHHNQIIRDEAAEEDAAIDAYVEDHSQRLQSSLAAKEIP